MTGNGGVPMRWASPGGEPWHALTLAEVDAAPSRGWCIALCGQLLPGEDLAPTEVPSGALCHPCAVLALAELPEPRSRPLL